MDGRINQEPALKPLFDDLQKQIDQLRNLRFTAPNVTADPTHPRKGDLWLNTTTNQLKIVDATGSVRIISWT